MAAIAPQGDDEVGHDRARAASFDPLEDDRPHDECGVFGIYYPGHEVARLTYFGLFALQHRGQESAGIATCEGGHITTMRDGGLVSQVFDEEKLRALTGNMAIGHVRYSTTGGGSWENAQPIWRDDGRELERKKRARRRAEAMKEARQQLLAIVQEWSLARGAEAFFEDAERRAAELPADDRAVVLDRLTKARTMLGGTDALGRLRDWKASDDR